MMSPSEFPVLDTLLEILEPDPNERPHARRHLARLLAAQAQGNTAIEVSAEEAAWLMTRPWVGHLQADKALPPTPTVLHNQRLQFHIYWQAERKILEGLASRVPATATDAVAELSTDFLTAAEQYGLDPEKVQQIRRALAQSLTLLTGGPGTGKTTTLAWLLAALMHRHPQLTIALAAPTGKAAQRMKAALDQALPDLPLPQAQKADLEALQPATLHRLLGIGPLPQPRHTPDRPLPHDLVVVDEASMIDVLTLSKLVQALRPDSRLILMGDPNQLASVEAGSVLADLCTCFPAAHCQLTRSHRFNQEIGALADAVLNGDADRVWHLLTTPQNPAIRQLPLQGSRIVEAAFQGYGPFLDQLAQSHADEYTAIAEQASALLNALSRFRMLSPLRHHPIWGTEKLNQQLIRHFQLKPLGERIHVGQPILIQENDYALELFNGDQGIILPLNNTPMAWFEQGRQMRAIPVSQLPAWETAFAMTVHKSQGAEFDEVMLIIPDMPEKQPSHTLLSRELVYTALTRARRRFTLAGTRHSLAGAVNTPTRRVTGLGR